MKVLLIDDDAFLRDMYATKFAECGHEVVSADQATAAMTVLANQTDIDVVLVDMVMPGMSGTELITQIKAEGLAADAIIIVLSNQSQKADIDEALAAGAVDYIVKAEHIPSEVVAKVEQISKS